MDFARRTAVSLEQQIQWHLHPLQAEVRSHVAAPTSPRDGYDGSLEAAVTLFARSYDGYALHGDTPELLTTAVAHVLDLNDIRFVGGPLTPVEDLRAALFALQRACSIASLTLSEQPATFDLLRMLDENHPRPFMQLSLLDDVRGLRPDADTARSWLLDSIPDLVRLALLVLPEHVDPDQLAWLGLTSKPELAIRDLLGWLLQQSLPPDAAVTREWRRSDLAVLINGQPQAVIEGKAIYGFDALNPKKLNEYASNVEADLAKAALVAPDAFSAAILSVTTPISEWLPSSNAAVAYMGNRRTAIAGIPVLEDVSSAVRTRLLRLGQVAELAMPRGQAFGSEVATSLFFVCPSRSFRRAHERRV